MVIKLVKIRQYELGLYFRDGEFRELLEPARYWFFDPLFRVRVDIVSVPAGHAGVWFRDGSFVETLPAGRYAFWKNIADVKVVPVDTRELILDVAGQEIMTADKVTLRLNALVSYRVADARLAVSV